MPLSLVATRDANDAVTALTLTGSALQSGKIYNLTLNGTLIGSPAVKGNGTINFSISNIATLPAAVQNALAIFCTAGTTTTTLGHVKLVADFGAGPSLDVDVS